MGSPGCQAPPSEFPLCLGLGQTHGWVPGRVRLQEPRVLAGHAWHGARGRLSALGLSPSAAPLALPGNPGNGRVAGPASMEGPPGERVLPVSGGAVPGGPGEPGGQRACILTQQEVEGLVLGCGQQKSQQEPRAQFMPQTAPRPANEPQALHHGRRDAGESRTSVLAWLPASSTRSRCCSSTELTPPLAPAVPHPFQLSSAPTPVPIRPSLVRPCGGWGRPAKASAEGWARPTGVCCLQDRAGHGGRGQA